MWAGERRWLRARLHPRLNNVVQSRSFAVQGGACMTTTSTVSLADALRPVAPPRTIEGVYTDDEYRRLLARGAVVWTVARPSSGTLPFRRRAHRDRRRRRCPKDHGLTLDDIATALPRLLRQELGAATTRRARTTCFYNSGSSATSRRTGARVREADADAVQHLRTAQQRAQPAPRRGDVPRCADREHAGVAAEHHGQVGPVHRLPREDGADHHVVVPREDGHLHLLARRPASSRRNASSTRSGTGASSCRTR